MMMVRWLLDLKTVASKPQIFPVWLLRQNLKCAATLMSTVFLD